MFVANLKISTMQIEVEKPIGYKSCFIVNDPYPTLIINLTTSVWQLKKQLSSDETDEFEISEGRMKLFINKIE